MEGKSGWKEKKVREEERQNKRDKDEKRGEPLPTEEKREPKRRWSKERNEARR